MEEEGGIETEITKRVGLAVASRHTRGPIDNISCGPLSGLSQT